MSKEQLQLALWVSQPILQAIIAVVVYGRRLHKDFPAFFSFTVAQIVIFAVEYPVYNWAGADAYFYVFWISAALNVVFAFQIIHEVFIDAFKPYPALKDLGTALELADATGTPAPLGAACREVWAAAQAQLEATADHTAVVRWLETLARTTLTFEEH